MGVIEQIFRRQSKTAQRVILSLGVVVCWCLAVFVFQMAAAYPEPNPRFLFSFGFAGGGVIFAQALIHHVWYGWV